jgi:PBP1b-binding outer membrane lipoprotein LpoB
MRATLLAGALIIAGCANQPTAPPNPDQDAQRVAEAIKHGYKVTTTEGETLYCRSDFATASHIQKNTVCLTAQQLDDLDQQNQRTFDQPSRGAANGLPPMGSH